MRVYWTLASALGFAVGLWETDSDAEAMPASHGLARHDMNAIPIYAAGLPNDLADQLVAARVAPGVIDGLDGSALACQQLAQALRIAAPTIGRAEVAEEERRITLSAAGRLCFWCGPIARAAGYVGD